MTHDSRTHRRSAVPGSASRAFSLVEILIAILILGLGLLGLGAVFPAVIAQQRGAVEKTQGAAVAASAAATVSTNSAKTCPARSPRKLENATRFKLTESRISSTDINRMMTFLRFTKIPNTPIVNRIAATAR